MSEQGNHLVILEKVTSIHDDIKEIKADVKAQNGRVRKCEARIDVHEEKLKTEHDRIIRQAGRIDGNAKLITKISIRVAVIAAAVLGGGEVLKALIK